MIKSVRQSPEHIETKLKEALSPKKESSVSKLVKCITKVKH